MPEREFAPLSRGSVGTFPETVTVRRFNPEHNVFLSTKENVGALRFGHKDGSRNFYLSLADAGPVKVAPGSEIIDADGNVYVVHESPRAAEHWLVRVGPRIN